MCPSIAVVADAETAVAHLNNGRASLVLLHSLYSSLRPTAEGRLDLESEGKQITDAISTARIRLQQAAAAHLALIPLKHPTAVMPALDFLDRAEAEGRYCARAWLSYRGQEGGPRRCDVLGVLSSLNAAMLHAVNAVEAAEYHFRKEAAELAARPFPPSRRVNQ